MLLALPKNQKYGSVQPCDLVSDKVTGGSRGFTFVEMPKPGEARVAMKNVNSMTVVNNKIRVKKAENKAK